ncbi:hypothetical protein F5890DRAFT_1560285 [Lentinula detonsa]|uniref:Uncharacterized protein n=1 Tax=Lentinula detonsa TaxID=2804962 RepID=A0AA38PNP2_9AGAR|nr:hypothetical protein F5890DRAFT_1560285 [Lentinula detonsa]
MWLHVTNNHLDWIRKQCYNHVSSGLTPDPSLHSRNSSPKFRTLSRSLVTLVALTEAFAASHLYIFTSSHLCIFVSPDHSNFVTVLHVAETIFIAIALNVSRRLALSRIIFARTPRTERSKGVANSFAVSYPASLGDQAST